MADGQTTRSPAPSGNALVVSIHDIFPFSDGGMAIRGSEIANLIAERMPIYVLTGNGVRTGDVSYWRSDVDGHRFLPVKEQISWSLGEYASDAWVRWWIKPRLQALTARLSPRVCFFNQFEGFSPEVIEVIFGCKAPMFARFGDRHGGVLLDVIKQRNPLDRGACLTDCSRGVPLMTFVFNCEFLRRYYSAELSTYGVESLVIYDGVDSDLFYPCNEKPDRPIFVFMSRTFEKKGFLEFCRAMTLLPVNLIGGIHVIGDGDDLEAGLTIIKDSGRGHLLKAGAAAVRNDAAERLRVGSIFVLPSWDEGLPAAAMEAMASGLAVICSRVGGIPEFISNGETGLLVEPKKFEELVGACRKLAEDKGLRESLGQAGRTVMVQKFRRGDGLSKYQALIDKKIGEDGRQRNEFH